MTPRRVFKNDMVVDVKYSYRTVIEQAHLQQANNTQSLYSVAEVILVHIGYGLTC